MRKQLVLIGASHGGGGKQISEDSLQLLQIIFEIVICYYEKSRLYAVLFGDYYCFYNLRYDINNDTFLDLMEMKNLMEKLGAPQTHIGLKAMIKEVDEDNDSKVSFREVSYSQNRSVHEIEN